MKKDFRNIFAYLSGTFFCRLYYSKLNFLVPTYIKKTVLFRMSVAQACYVKGSCVHCGCKTPDLFFAKKGCAVGCYPERESLILQLKRNEKK